MSLVEIYLVELLARIDRLLRGERNEMEQQRISDVLILLIAAGCWYGMVMGSYGGIGPAHWRQIFYSAVKVPLLLSVTFWLSVPSFYVLNSLLGLRADFGQAMRAIVGAQAALTIILAALAPLTGFIYLSGCAYSNSILFNGMMFCIASVGGQLVLRRSYLFLIARNPRHRWAVGAWLVIYVFMGIQMGWVLRPFVGNPDLPTRFLRSDALTNAYVEVGRLVWNGLR
ncbi:MAG TPA: hypothetical protein VGG19_06525 [Tepidisphaeraceae bacterium]|jgi:hypothetical protein